MPVKYNGFAQGPAVLKLMLPAAIVIFAGCASAPKEAPPPAAAAEAPAPPTPVTDTGQAVAAADVSLRQDAPLTYTVKKGDTLWGIAGYFLQDPWQWPQLWYDNPYVKNPHLIYPGDQLRLVWVNGRPRLSLDGSSGIYHLSPSVHESSLDQGLPAISADSIRQFLHSPRSVSLDEMKSAPYVVGIADEHVAGGANDDIFAKGVPADKSQWAVVEPGDPYIDPDTHELLGYEALPVGNAQLRTHADVSTLRMTTSDREATAGNRLLPVDSGDFVASFIPHAPAKPVSGKIISVYGGVAQAAQYQVVVINRGIRDGIDIGTVLSVHRAGEMVPDPYKPGQSVQLPDLYGGSLMVFKTAQRLSYALVVVEKRPIHTLDKVVKPITGEH
jgi:hypothetical protein